MLLITHKPPVLLRAMGRVSLRYWRHPLPPALTLNLIESCCRFLDDKAQISLSPDQRISSKVFPQLQNLTERIEF